MISLDRGLLGAAGSGDVAERHKKYASLAGALDIIVFASPKYSQLTLAPNLRVFPTRSSKFAHFHRAAELTKKLLKENQYDLLVTQEFTAPAGLKIKKFLDIPWIINIHSMFFSTQWLGFNLIYWYLFFLFRCYRRDLPHIHTFQKRVARYFRKYARERFGFDECTEVLVIIVIYKRQKVHACSEVLLYFERINIGKINLRGF